MYTCICNAIREKAIDAAIADPAVKNTAGAVYKAASNGCKMQCCKCLPEIEAKIIEHVSALGVAEIKRRLPAPAPQPEAA